jgi:hypothetical protein
MWQDASLDLSIRGKAMRRLICSIVVTLAAANAYADTDVICTYAPSQDAAVNRISGLVGGAGAGAQAMLTATGLTVVSHSSGAAILTGAAGYIPATMAGATAAAVLIPATIIVGTAAVTFELACAPKNHPALVSKIVSESKPYWQKSKQKMRDLTKVYSEADPDVLKSTGDYWASRVERLLSKD